MSLGEVRTILLILGGNKILAGWIRGDASCQWLSDRHAFL